MTSDDELRSFLDYIARHEGTANRPNRGYDTTLGYGRYLPGGKETDLSSKSLAEVSRLQKQMLANPDNPFNSSAAGRYQIVNKTLRGLVDKLGLDWNDKFSPQCRIEWVLPSQERVGMIRPAFVRNGRDLAIVRQVR